MCLLLFLFTVVCSLLFLLIVCYSCLLTVVCVHCCSCSLLFLFAHCCVCSLLFLLIVFPVCSCLPLARAFLPLFSAALFYILYCQMKISVLFNHRCFHLFILRFVLPDESKRPFQRHVLSPLYFTFCIARSK